MLMILYLVVVAGGMSMAHYRIRVDDRRNLVEREEQTALDISSGFPVECPVCDDSQDFLPTLEECPIIMGNKKLKLCKWGTYINKRCGNKPDCYRGPGDRCTEKMDSDIYDQRCAPGYYCNKVINRCTGLGFSIDSNYLSKYPELRYQLRSRQDS